MNTPSKEALEAAKESCDLSIYATAVIIDRHFAPLRERVVELEYQYRDLRVAYEQNSSQCVKLNRELALKQETKEWLNGTTLLRERAEQAEARVKELEATCAELVTDGNALTLAANLAKQSQRAEQAEARVKELEKQNELLICDRARFPDKSCEVGNIIAAHIENLKSTSESNAEAWRWACVRENALKERNDELVAALRDLHGYPADNDVHKHAAEVLARHAAGEPAKHPDTVTEEGLTGIKFRDAKSGREVMLITEGEWRDWIACKRPDGLWVSMRVATEQDRAALQADILARWEVQP